jgi:hypothetical protein
MSAQSNRGFHVYSVANDPAVLARDLQSSPDIASGNVPVSVLWNERSASEAYAREIAGATADLLVFVHQDVYLPRGWFDRLARQLDRLQKIDPNWAIAGSFGVTHWPEVKRTCSLSTNREFVGHIWDSGLGCVFGRPVSSPIRVASLDEIVLIIRRASGVCFDPQLPTFHLYGTDIILSAEKCGKSAYVLDLPVIHNSTAIRRVDPHYVTAYRYMVHKWHNRLPWPTLIVPLTSGPIALARQRLRLRWRALFHREQFFDRLSDPRAKARELGFEVA